MLSVEVRPCVIVTLAAVVLSSTVAGAQQRPFTKFGSEAGLQQLVATSITQDRRGFIWVATEGGLHRLQTDRFEEVPVDGRRGQPIGALIRGEPGDLWLATLTHLYRHRAGLWTKFGKAQGLMHRIQALAWTESALWVGTLQGLYRFAGGRFEVIDQVPFEAVHSVQVVGDQVWVGSSAGLFVHRGGGWQRLSSRACQALAPALNKKGMWAYVGDRLGLWVVPHNSADSARVVHSVAITGPVKGLVVDDRSTVWMGVGRGLAEVDGDEVRIWGESNGLDLSDIHTLFIDHEGTLWLGGAGGVSNLADYAFQTYGLREGLPSKNVRPVVRDKQGRLWVGSSRGLAFLKDGRFQPLPGMTDAVFALSVAPSGALWIGHARGVHTWTRHRGLRRERRWKRAGPVRALAHHPDGSTWIAGAGQVGLVRRTRRGAYEAVQIPGNTLTNPRLLITRDGRVWVSGDDGLSVFDGRMWRTYTMADGLAAPAPYFLAEDTGGALWFGYHHPAGVTRFDGAKFETYTKADGLSSDRVFSVGVDPRGHVWIGGTRGVDRFDGENFINFAPADGFPSFEANAGGFLSDTDGSLWMSTMEGLAHYRADRVGNVMGPPDVRVSGLFASGSTVAIGSVVGPDTALVLNYEINTRYRRNHVEFRYRIRGREQDEWLRGSGGQILIRPLPQGEYTVEVQSRRAPGGWSPVWRGSIEVVGPVWAQWWFWLVAVLAVLGLASLLRRAWQNQPNSVEAIVRREVDKRTKTLARTVHEAEGARAAAEQANKAKSGFLANMSHEIRTPLNAVLGTTSLLMDTELDAEQQELALTAQRSSEALLELVNEVLDFSRIEAGYLELDNGPVVVHELVLDALRLVAPRAHDKHLSLSYFLSADVPHRTVGDEARLRQVLINLVTNGVKFTRTGEVGVEVERPRPNRLRLTVRDTGIGIPADAQATLFDPFTQVESAGTQREGGSGLGLAISHRLITAMGGEIVVNSAPGQGAAFSVTLPHSPAGVERPSAMAGADALEGQSIDVVAAGHVLRRSLEAWLRSWGAQTRGFASTEEFVARVNGRAEVTVLALNGWPEPVDLDKLPAEAKISADRLVVVGPLRPTTAQWATVAEPVRPERLLQTLRRVLERKAAVEPAPALTKKPRFTSTLGAEHPLSILVVDDNRVNREVASRMLKRLGYREVICKEDGESAIAEVVRTRPDLIFMDVQMPGIDGLETTRRIRKLNLEVNPRIVALTAGVLAEDRRACDEAGMDDFIAKPVSVRTLTEALQRCPPPSSPPRVGQVTQASALTRVSSDA